jgi:hypothetical protein
LQLIKFLLFHHYITIVIICFLSEPNLKLKMRVQLVNAAGLDEAGIDGGGIFREFLSELLKTGFDPATYEIPNGLYEQIRHTDFLT